MGALLYLLALPPALIMILRALSLVLPGRLAQLASFYAFSITGFLLLMICAIYGVMASIALRLVGYGGLSQWTVARAFKWTMWWTTGVTFRVSGSMKATSAGNGEDALRLRPAVFLGNHQRCVQAILCAKALT